MFHKNLEGKASFGTGVAYGVKGKQEKLLQGGRAGSLLLSYGET